MPILFLRAFVNNGIKWIQVFKRVIECFTPALSGVITEVGARLRIRVPRAYLLVRPVTQTLHQSNKW